jgi:hypothetical protein
MAGSPGPGVSGTRCSGLGCSRRAFVSMLVATERERSRYGACSATRRGEAMRVGSPGRVPQRSNRVSAERPTRPSHPPSEGRRAAGSAPWAYITRCRCSRSSTLDEGRRLVRELVHELLGTRATRASRAPMWRTGTLYAVHERGSVPTTDQKAVLPCRCPATAARRVFEVGRSSGSPDDGQVGAEGQWVAAVVRVGDLAQHTACQHRGRLQVLNPAGSAGSISRTAESARRVGRLVVAS